MTTPTLERSAASHGPEQSSRSRRLAAAAHAARALRQGTVPALPCPGAWPDHDPTEILEGLFQGGTQDGDVLSVPGDDYRDGRDWPFDLVVTLYACAQPAPWEVEELRYGFLDGALHGTDTDTLERLAAYAFARWVAGASVLVRCQAGVNRSGLITAMVLMHAGLTAPEAVELIRRRRGSVCLGNEHFADWLHTR